MPNTSCTFNTVTLCRWGSMESSNGPKITDLSSPIPEYRTALPLVWHSSSVECAFEPLGGLDVVIFLLGQVVCDEMDNCRVIQHCLQAKTLDLLLSMIEHSVSMSNRFYAPTLPNLGVERSFGNYSNRPHLTSHPPPLGFGDCLLARLLKHPRFAGSAETVVNVLSQHLFTSRTLRTSTTSTTHNNSSVRHCTLVFTNPRLLRCLLLFGPPDLWLSSSPSTCSSGFLADGLLAHTFTALSSTLMHSSSFTVVTTIWLDQWHIIPIALSAFREHFLEHRSNHCQSHWPLPPLLHLCLCRLLSAPDPIDCNAIDETFNLVTRELFANLCRSIISLDADMYLLAAERVFSAGSRWQSPLCFNPHVDSDVPALSWQWWHKLITRCVRPEHWALWTGNMESMNEKPVSQTVCSTERSGPTQQAQTALTPDAHSPVKNGRTGLVDWTCLPNKTTGTELDTLVRYSKDLLPSTRHRASRMPMLSSSEDSDAYVTGCSSTEIGTEADEYVLETGDCYPLHGSTNTESSSHSSHESTCRCVPSAPDGKQSLTELNPVTTSAFAVHETKTISNSEVNQRFATCLVQVLDTAWSVTLNSSPPVGVYESLNFTTLTSPNAAHRNTLLNALKPPLWLVHSLLGHPWVEMREAGLNGYGMWLRHALSDERICKRIQNRSCKLHEIITTQLLLLSPPLHLSDPQLQFRSATSHRHICSQRLLRNAFALILNECLAPSSSSSALFTLDNWIHDSNTVSAQQDGFEFSSHCFPILLAVLAGSVADAVMSLHTTSFPTAMQLCVSGFKALTNLLQCGNDGFLLPALDAGLIPVLYSSSWLLELGVVKPDITSVDHRFTNLAPILTCLSRLSARVTEWLLDNVRFPISPNKYTPEYRFRLTTDFVHQLLVMSPLTTGTQPHLKDQGPISRCLVRRILYSLLDTTVRILSSTTEPTRDIRRLSVFSNPSTAPRPVELLKWVVNTTVDVLLYSTTHKSQSLYFLKSFDPSSGSILSSSATTHHAHSHSRMPNSPGPFLLPGGNPLNVQTNPASTSARPHPTSRSIPDISSSWTTSNCSSYPGLHFQQGLDQALITLLFNTASDIQNGILFSSVSSRSKAVFQADCLAVFYKALGRLLMGKIQPPTVEVVADPVATFLLRLCNEERLLLSNFMADVPRLSLLVFRTNLSELQFWLSRLKDSGVLSSTSTAYLTASLKHRKARSSSLSRLSKSSSLDLTFRQLEQLLFTVQSLLSLHTVFPEIKPDDRFSHPTIVNHRNLLLLAQKKNEEKWLSSLPQPPECYSELASPLANKNVSKARPSLLISLLLTSFGVTESPNSNASTQDSQSSTKTRPSNKMFSVKRLSSQAHRLCIDGNRTWRDAFGERLRLAGPLGTILWARVADRLDHVSSPLHNPASAPTVLCLDPIEGPMRERRRMFLTHLPLADRLVYPGNQHLLAQHRDPHTLASLIGLPRHSTPLSGRSACVWSDLPLYLPLPATPLVQLASASRHHAVGVWACRLIGVIPIIPVDGDLILGRSWLRFQPDSPGSDSANNAIDCLFDVKPVDRLWLAWSLSAIDRIEERRYALRDVAVEIFPDGTGASTSALFALRSVKERDAFLQTFHQHQQTIQGGQPFNMMERLRHSTRQRVHALRIRSAQHKWLTGQLSNFAYVMELNSLAGRSYNDLMQYPIFPWVLQDYTSTVLDLGHPSSYRRMDRPIAVQFPERAEAVARYYKDAELSNQCLLKELAESDTSTVPTDLVGLVCPPYHYPSHCSNEAIVLNFLVRLLPFTFRHLRFQDNSYDVPDRTFHSVATTWNLTTTSVTCVKELVPEFYFLPELFTNSAGLSLGVRQFGVPVDSVELPPWSKNNARLFTLVCRAALESDFITSLLSEWIDLTFGYKQTGVRAKEALNLYHPYTYFGAVDVGKIEDPIRAQAVEAMINNYGQTPKQLLRRHPHPSRFSLVIKNEEANIIPNQPFNNDAVCDADESDDFESFNRVTSTGDGYAAADSGDVVSSRHSLYSASVHNDVTPLETVIGLRWGQWAGSPHAAPLKLAWKLHPSSDQLGGLHGQLSATSKAFGFTCGALWNELSSRVFSCTGKRTCDESTNALAKTLMNSWDGCVVTCTSAGIASHVCENIESQQGTSTSDSNDSSEWGWTVLGCEPTACLWLASSTSTGQMQLVKVMRSPHDPIALWLRTRSLWVKDAKADTVIPLLLPMHTRGGTVTALAISHVSPKKVQLFVGTSWGSIYVRYLPSQPEEVPSTGWIPENARYDDWPDMVGISDVTDVNEGTKRFPDDTFVDECREAGLWEVTGWRHLVGHGCKSITALSACRHFGLFASGDQAGGVCLWDLYRFVLIRFVDTIYTVEKQHILNYSFPPDTTLLSERDCVEGFITVELPSPGESICEKFKLPAHSCSLDSNDENRNAHHIINGLCFSPTSGELAVARWNEHTFRACWIGVYRPSGVRVLTRILDFFAEITDGNGNVGCLNPSDMLQCDSIPPLPMAYSTTAEGRGVNCLLLGGPGGRLVWLNSWTLDTVRTMLLSHVTETMPSPITSLCFIPSSELFLASGCHPLGDMLCQGLCVADQSGWVYYLVPEETKSVPKSLRTTKSTSFYLGNRPRLRDKLLNRDRAIAGLWLG